MSAKHSTLEAFPDSIEQCQAESKAAIKEKKETDQRNWNTITGEFLKRVKLVKWPETDALLYEQNPFKGQRL